MSRATDPTLAFVYSRIGRLTRRITDGQKLTSEEWDELTTLRAQARRIELAYYPGETKLIGHEVI